MVVPDTKPKASSVRTKGLAATAVERTSTRWAVSCWPPEAACPRS
jgi:hypothetical protein